MNRAHALVSGKHRTSRIGLDLVPVALALCAGLIAGMELTTTAGCGFVAFALQRALVSQDRPITLQWLIIFVAGLQWVVAPALVYQNETSGWRSTMVIPEGAYMSSVLPAFLAMSVGILAIGGRADRAAQIRGLSHAFGQPRFSHDVPIVLLAFSLMGTFSAILFPEGFGFVGYLLSNLKYSAAILVLISGHPSWRLWTVVVFGLSAVESLASSLFHDLILWLTIYALVYAFIRNTSRIRRILFILAGLILLTITQAVKGDYRAQTAAGEAQASATTYLRMASEAAEQIGRGERTPEQIYGDFLARINQGWIISEIIYYMQFRPLAGGETIREGLVAAFVPRVFMPDKATAGGQETLKRLSGRTLSAGTSMGASILGEGHGNFGAYGNILFMFLFGLSLSGMASLLRVAIGSYPTYLALLPAVFVHAIKAETDFVTTANYVVKGALLYTVIFFLFIGAGATKRAIFSRDRAGDGRGGRETQVLR